MIAEVDIALLDRWQRDFPLVAQPFARIAESEGVDEAELLDRLRGLAASGVLSRVGAVVRPHSAGWSTLAAIAVPPERLDAVAAIVSAHALVNHNYGCKCARNLERGDRIADPRSADGALLPYRPWFCVDQRR
jgi:siroheme decarboxylase